MASRKINKEKEITSYSDLCVLIVLFKPEEDDLHYIRRLKVKVNCFVVDNTPENECLSGCGGFDDLVDCKNFNRGGLAGGINLGVLRIQEKGGLQVLYLDQDSRLLVEDLKDFYSISMQLGDDIVFGSGYEGNTLKGKLQSFFWKNNRGVRMVKTVILSGCMFSIYSWKKVGGFDEALAVDSVDHDFCIKVWHAGGKVVQSRRKMIKHSIGVNSVFGSFSLAPMHSSERVRSIFKNTTMLIARYWSSEPIWAFSQIIRLLYETVCLIFTPSPLEKLRFAASGFLDGLPYNEGK